MPKAPESVSEAAGALWRLILEYAEKKFTADFTDAQEQLGARANSTSRKTVAASKEPTPKRRR